MNKYSIHNKLKSILKMLNELEKEKHYKVYNKADLIQENVINKLILFTRSLQKGNK